MSVGELRCARTKYCAELIEWWNVRNKSPEYALYMLNRQTVKNVFMPLVPGEMKLSVVDASTLQVARRGESEQVVLLRVKG